MDPNTALAILGAAAGSAKVVEKLLGPTADYLGSGIRNWTERRVTNVGRIFQKATQKLGEEIENEGSVPPKVLKDILEEGSFSDDELTAEYFGGVLASSRTGVSRDDRGAVFTRLISRLSTYQIRSHYFFYNVIKHIFHGQEVNVAIPQGRASLEVYIPVQSYTTAMEFTEDENSETIAQHVLFGLAREALIGDRFDIGPHHHMQTRFSRATAAGLIIQPSALGIELLLWASGKGHLGINDFLKPEVSLNSGVTINTVPGFEATQKPPPANTNP